MYPNEQAPCSKADHSDSGTNFDPQDRHMDFLLTCLHWLFWALAIGFAIKAVFHTVCLGVILYHKAGQKASQRAPKEDNPWNS